MESRISHFVMLSYFDGVLWNICFHLHLPCLISTGGAVPVDGHFWPLFSLSLNAIA